MTAKPKKGMTMENRKKSENSLIEVTAQAIHRYILEHELEPNDKLPAEHELISLLEVSRSTLREAVRMLASRNILIVRHGAGIYVSPKLGMADDPFGLSFVRDKEKLLRDLIEIRSLLEPKCAALAAMNASDAELKALRAHLARLEALPGNQPEFFSEDKKLHLMIARASHNIILPRMLPSLIDTIHELQLPYLPDYFQRFKFSRFSHREIVDAICARNTVAAWDAMLLHQLRHKEVIAIISGNGSAFPELIPEPPSARSSLISL